MPHPQRDQCLALSSDRVLLFNVINVMYAWFHMHFVSSLMLTIKHHQCLPAMSPSANDTSILAQMIKQRWIPKSQKAFSWTTVTVMDIGN